jgi:small subunit ribosomal protein S2
LACVYWLLTREVLKSRGQLTRDEDYKLTIDDFEASL